MNIRHKRAFLLHQGITKEIARSIATDRARDPPEQPSPPPEPKTTEPFDPVVPTSPPVPD